MCLSVVSEDGFADRRVCVEAAVAPIGCAGTSEEAWVLGCYKWTPVLERNLVAVVTGYPPW